MTSKGRTKTSLYHLTRELADQGDFFGMLDEILKGSDRACALVSGTYVEQCVAIFLKKHMIELDEKQEADLFFEPRSPLSTFSAKIELAWALGLISDDERGDLNCIRRIRNAFAHRVLPLAFDNPLVKREINKLHTKIILSFEEYEKDISFDNDSVRAIFISSVLYLENRIVHDTLEYTMGKVYVHKKVLSGNGKVRGMAVFFPDNKKRRVPVKHA